MAQNDTLRRYLDAGIAFTQLTRSRAEAIVKDLVHTGEIQREHAQDRVEELIDRSRKNTEALVDMIRKEIRTQLSALGVPARPGRATTRAAAPPAKKAAATKKKAPAATKTAVKKKAPAKKSAAKKKAPAKKSASRPRA
jgi:polyhydroxyalkanoate synthesis regulator phasin